VQLATEPGSSAVGFAAGSDGSWDPPAIKPLRISPRRRLDDALRVVDEMPMGGTDCAQPMLYALAKGLEIDTFVVYTDNETWHGDIHPHQALRQYRERTGIPARLVVVGMTATEFSIADPSDPGMLDVAGFDAAVPSLISQFARGM
jgi:60 kDa SS-A/Ro ribonucleoprotein